MIFRQIDLHSVDVKPAACWVQNEWIGLGHSVLLDPGHLVAGTKDAAILNQITVHHFEPRVQQQSEK
jgi:hypothetical protein